MPWTPARPASHPRRPANSALCQSTLATSATTRARHGPSPGVQAGGGRRRSYSARIACAARLRARHPRPRSIRRSPEPKREKMIGTSRRTNAKRQRVAPAPHLHPQLFMQKSVACSSLVTVLAVASAAWALPQTGYAPPGWDAGFGWPSPPIAIPIRGWSRSTSAHASPTSRSPAHA